MFLPPFPIPTLPRYICFDHSGYEDWAMVNHYRTHIRRHTSNPGWLLRACQGENRPLVQEALRLEYDRVTLLRPALPYVSGVRPDELLRSV